MLRLSIPERSQAHKVIAAGQVRAVRRTTPGCDRLAASRIPQPGLEIRRHLSEVVSHDGDAHGLTECPRVQQQRFG
jgi:hypothetical protein